MRYLTLFILLITNSSYGNETSEAFIVRLYDRNIKVISPANVREMVSVIIENKSNSKMLGKVVRNKGEVIKFFSLSPEEHGVVETKIAPHERLFYVPVSPAFQTVELIFGKDSYEIPRRP